MSMDIDRTPGVRHDLTENPGFAPVVWPFRVKWMEFVEPAGVKEWQQKTAEETGITVTEDILGCATTSGCTGGWDDSDWWGNGCPPIYQPA